MQVVQELQSITELGDRSWHTRDATLLLKEKNMLRACRSRSRLIMRVVIDTTLRSEFPLRRTVSTYQSLPRRLLGSRIHAVMGQKPSHPLRSCWPGVLQLVRNIRSPSNCRDAVKQDASIAFQLGILNPLQDTRRRAGTSRLRLRLVQEHVPVRGVLVLASR